MLANTADNVVMEIYCRHEAGGEIKFIRCW